MASLPFVLKCKEGRMKMKERKNNRMNLIFSCKLRSRPHSALISRRLGTKKCKRIFIRKGYSALHSILQYSCDEERSVTIFLSSRQSGSNDDAKECIHNHHRATCNIFRWPLICDVATATLSKHGPKHKGRRGVC